jgi:hypothetical protein
MPAELVEILPAPARRLTSVNQLKVELLFSPRISFQPDASYQRTNLMALAMPSGPNAKSALISSSAEA